jgi:hypothetical protein
VYTNMKDSRDSRAGLSVEARDQRIRTYKVSGFYETEHESACYETPKTLASCCGR